MSINDVIARLRTFRVLNRSAHLGGTGQASSSAGGIAITALTEVLINEPGFALALLLNLLCHRIIPTLVPAVHFLALNDIDNQCV